MQFKAAYIVDTIANVVSEFRFSLDKKSTKDIDSLGQINGLLQQVSAFDVEFPYKHNPDFQNLNPVLATLNNIVSRGLPTKAPVLLEKLFVEINLTYSNNDEFELNFTNAKVTTSYETIFNLLHIIEPKLEISRGNYGGTLGSELEWDFIKKHPFLIHILESQRDFSSISDKLQGRTVDFSFSSPYLHWNVKNNCYEKIGRIFEVDGPHHSHPIYRHYDAYRDAISDAENFETLRFTVESIQEEKIDFDNLIGKDIYRIFKSNFEMEVKDSLADYSLIFIPLAVARIQKTIIEYLMVNLELFTQDSIHIAIIERDFPCGAIAVKSLQELFFNINEILEDEDKLVLPEIVLSIFETNKWVIDERLHLQANRSDEIFFKKNKFDIVVDHSILRRSNVYSEDDFQCNNAIKIRSSHYFDTSFGSSRRVYCAQLLNYKALVSKQDDGSYKSVATLEEPINYFIQNTFRKKAFREGQLPIISRALQKKPVIGLLPTGGGKSLAYQLPVLLQPGLCLVVDPIKSLMEDQVRVLNENWIDCCNFLNSNLKQKEKLKKLIDFRYGESMFLFVSPERFVMDDFRKIIQNIDTSKFGLAFSYVVIDEVHCVSEWGHDFRTTYLMLGKNSQLYSKTRGANPVTLIGLTATASFDILADIERELQIDHGDLADAIIMIENTIRPELFFRVIDVTNKNRIKELNIDFINMGTNLSKLNNEKIIEQSKEHHRANFNPVEEFSESLLFKDKQGELIELNKKPHNNFFAIIFCPVRGLGGNEIGVDFVYKNINSNSKGFFYSSDNDELNDEVQENFRKFTSDVTKHMVCTKAFGMGIDKKDIRSTYHYVYSSSLESLVQEAGRSGRDRKIAEANILVSKSKYFKLDIYKLFSENKDSQLIQNRLTRKLIRKLFEKKWVDGKYENIVFGDYLEVIAAVDAADFNLPQESASSLKEMLQEIGSDERYKYIYYKYYDRDIWDFFHQRSYKGVDTERAQFINLFKIKEFQLIRNERVNIENQEALISTFDNCEKDHFSFLIADTKEFPDAVGNICKLIGAHGNEGKTDIVAKAFKYNHDFNDFLFLMDEARVVNLSEIDVELFEKIRAVYSRNRTTSQDTGRLIYRMHSMGFLEDYVIDYKTNIYKCTFRKFNSIETYISVIEMYLRRYLSEQEALRKIQGLKLRIIKTTIIENILECLFFLSEFSYKEIVSKRQRSTDEIESILNTSITDLAYTNDWYQQNIFIKEQIYFYFNAKYARIGFKINGNPYSLLDDYQELRMSKKEILNKYLEVFRIEGTEQNNYKHMMGSCKKILRSLSESDLNKEWLLRLLKAFAMYSVNNSSYIYEANAELEIGFDNLYRDEFFHKNDYGVIEPVFESYFSHLQNNIRENNPSFKDIRLIRAKILIKMQSFGIDILVSKNREIMDKIYV